jgi:hypothetical protein
MLYSIIHNTTVSGNAFKTKTNSKMCKYMIFKNAKLNGNIFGTI